MSTSTPTASDAPALDERPARPVGRPSPGSLGAAVVMAVLLGLGIWSALDLGISVPTILGSLGNAVDFAGRMVPLDFPPASELAAMILETLAIVVLSTVLAVVLSVPVSLAAARATTSGRITRGTARTVIVLARAVPDLVLAIVFLRLFGLGPLAGILAMGLHSVGMIGKLYADALEELDDAPRQAVEVVGGTRRQQIWAAIPQALLPQVVATALHRFDINLRTSVLLGYVGVGGIGLEIADALRALDYQRGMSLALVVLALCIAVELLSGAVRAAMLPRSGGRSTPSTWTDRLLDRSRGRQEPSAAARIEVPWSLARIRRLLGGLAVVVVTLAALAEVQISITVLLDGLLAIPETAMLFLPPGFGGTASTVFADLLVTLQIALAATLLGAILAVPIGVLAARTVVAQRAVHTGFRLLIVVIRGIPELILAIIFVVISGLGAVAGTLALALGAVGLLSKLIADSLEETDVRVQDAVRTVGATGPQVFFAATLRQAAPAFVAHLLYLLDTNIRSATLLGVVGAGGVGFLLLNAARVNQFEVVTAIVLLMVAVVLAVEALSIWLRRAVR
ncbi:phosphonate ABC transporter permease [Brachybacterium sp. P6-10-X1]|uniref:PhnE/PtxC family ABC transporter permease n=1 Tax=Brachybacterium sp. P6-10-X1 TaxID=1903186 RepID=UPI000971A77F|nr:ABC transporter permease subunit [Brachybacterium sp. P6-10-X1]APX33166.1 phosphonate ABC transporter permease [Brachybacterium sp. P6-10-X1]